MPDVSSILAEIDFALDSWKRARAGSHHDDLSDLGATKTSELVATLSSTIDRFAPHSSAFAKRAKEITDKYSPSASHIAHLLLFGVLSALRQGYERGFLSTVQELVHADVFADFLEMADHLLSQGYKDPAAVLVGGTLEEHLRKLCDKHGVPSTNANGEPRKASQMNDDLAKVAYDKLQQKGVTYWLDLRNKAAHGQYSEYVDSDVRQMLTGVRDFLTKYRA